MKNNGYIITAAFSWSSMVWANNVFFSEQLQILQIYQFTYTWNRVEDSTIIYIGYPDKIQLISAVPLENVYQIISSNLRVSGKH